VKIGSERLSKARLLYGQVFHQSNTDKKMDKVNKIVELAKKECEAHGAVVTTKRVNVLSILLLSKKAVSAYELVDLYEQMFCKPIPVILDFLQSKNLAHKLETANKFVVCTHVDCSHEHPVSQFLICKKCLKVKELSMSKPNFVQLKHTIEQAGFHLKSPQLEMNCICKACYASAK
jgi:Fur family zinc uptake transcriptional regulator